MGAQGFIPQQCLYAFRYGLGPLRVYEVGAAAGRFGQGGDVGGDDGGFTVQGLQHWYAKSFVKGGVEEYVGLLVKGGEVVKIGAYEVQ